MKTTTPEESKGNEISINLQVPTSFLKPLLKTETRRENKMWLLSTATKDSVQTKMGSALAIASTAGDRHLTVTSLPQIYEMFLSPDFQCTTLALLTSIGITMSTSIYCKLHPKTPLLLDEAPRLKLRTHIP